MADHHTVDPVGELTEDSQFVCIQLGAGPLDHRQLVMRVERGGGVAGKMFAAARDPLPSQCIVECAR